MGVVDAVGKDSWMIAETVVAEEMLRFAAGVIVADLQAFGDHPLLGKVELDLDLLVIKEPAAEEQCRDFEISLEQVH